MLEYICDNLMIIDDIYKKSIIIQPILPLVPPIGNRNVTNIAHEYNPREIVWWVKNVIDNNSMLLIIIVIQIHFSGQR